MSHTLRNININRVIFCKHVKSQKDILCAVKYGTKYNFKYKYNEI